MHPPLRILTTIYLPLTLRGIVAGVTLVFVVSLGFYITPALLGGGKVMMYAMVIEQQVREFLAWNFAGALSVILLAVTLMMFWLLEPGRGAPSQGLIRMVETGDEKAGSSAGSEPGGSCCASSAG